MGPWGSERKGDLSKATRQKVEEIGPSPLSYSGAKSGLADVGVSLRFPLVPVLGEAHTRCRRLVVQVQDKSEKKWLVHRPQSRVPSSGSVVVLYCSLSHTPWGD